MANINFPSNPTASQTYTFNGTTWTFNGVAWSTSQPGFGPQGATGPAGSGGGGGGTTASNATGYLYLFYNY